MVLSLTITASNQSIYYGTTLNLSTTLFTVSGLTNGDSVSSVTLKYNNSTSVPGTTSAGSYSIVPSTAVGNGLNN